MQTITTTTIRQAILNGKPLTEEEFMIWSNRYMVEEAPDLTTEELQNYVECFPEQFEAILNTHNPDIISKWYTISAVGWNSLHDPENELTYERGQVYISRRRNALPPQQDTPPPPTDDDLDWL